MLRSSQGALRSALFYFGGGSNAIGAFYAFLNDPDVQLIGVEAGCRGHSLGEHAARFNSEGGGSPGVLQGTYSYLLQDSAGQVAHLEGIICALESAHAVAECIMRAPKMSASDAVIVNLSGRGDKDIGILRENLAL